MWPRHTGKALAAAVAAAPCVARFRPGQVLLWLAVVPAVVGAALGAVPVSAAAQAGAGSFSDDDGSVHEPALDALASQGVLAGTECGENLVCPHEPLKRWEMAVWLVRVLDGADPDPVDASRSEDVDAELWWAPFVERLFELEVTVGCSTEPARFCPDLDVTRAQMATFLTRAFALGAAGSAGFADVEPASAHVANVDALASAGITVGCGRAPLRYCPANSVTRAQMATFLARALGLIELPASVRFIAVDSGSHHACGLRADRTVACWGNNLSRQADAPTGQFDAVDAGGRSADSSHSCGLRVDGTVTCWGDNTHGQADAPNARFISVSAGGGHTCGQRVDGTVVCWGDNRRGQSNVPEVEFLTVSAGIEHSCGLRADGTVACWGSDIGGQLDVPAGHFSTVSAGGVHSCGLRPDSTIACWGGDYLSLSDTPEGRFQMVSAGGGLACGLRVDGTLACWGNNFGGRADAPSGPFISVSAGGGHTCGLRADGTIACWGAHFASPREVPAGDFAAVVPGNSHACGLRADGTVACWGNSSSGQAYSPTGRFRAIAAGAAHSCGLRLDGRIECWGARPVENSDASDGEFNAVAASESYSCGLRVNGTVSCWDVGRYRGVQAPRGPFVEITAGDRFACGLRPDRTIACWTVEMEARPDPPGGQFNAVSAGRAHGCGLRTDGTVACWGDNSDGQADAPDGRFISVSAGGAHSCGLRTDGTVACWGDNSFGQTDIPDGQFQAIVAGSDYSCGVHTSGPVQCWGSHTFVPPPGVRRVFGPSQPDPGNCRPFGRNLASAGFPLPRQVSSTTGRLRVGVLFVDFPGAEAINSAQQESLKGLTYIKQYLESASYRKLRVEFVPLYRWLRAERSYSHYTAPVATGPNHITSAIDREVVQLADPDFDFSGVDTVMIVMPSARFAGGNALGRVETEEGSVSTLRINTSYGSSTSNWGPTASHELAHNLGLADLYPYTVNRHFVPTIPPEGKRWRHVELGLMGLSAAVPVDDRDPSGFTHASEMLAWTRRQLGWLDDDQIHCIDETTATVNLSPVADPGDGIAMAAVPLSAHELIVVESRRRIGYDEHAAVGDGAVVVYTVDAGLSSGDLPIKLAGDTGRGHTDESPILTVGESVTVRGYTITVIADDGDTHTVAISKTDDG